MWSFPAFFFENAGQPYRLFYTGEVAIPELTLMLDPGLYAVQAAVEAFRGGDLADTFVPVSNSEAITSVDPCSFALEGDVRGLQFLEENRDRTFTVTPIVPEPSTTALLLMAIAAGLCARRDRRI